MLFAIVLAFAVLPFGQAGAELADGKYSLPYQVNKTGSTSASIANDYFIKPATLVKKNGTMYVQLTLKNSSQFVKFESPSGGNKVVSTDAGNDRRTVQFNITSLTKAQTVNVRIEIPEEDYYHNYKIDFVWYGDNAKLIESYAKAAEAKPATTKPATTTAATDTAKQEAAKKAEAEKKAAEEKAKAEKAKKEEEAKKAEEAKAAEEAKLKEEEAAKEEEVKSEEATENKEEVVATTEAESETKTTAASTTEGETADAATTDSSEKSGSATGWIIGLVAVVLVAAGAFLFFRKSKTA